MSKNDTWMPLYLGDYLADTMHLNGSQHGAYLLLLMHYWRNGPLPNDDAKLAGIARTDAKLWRSSVGPVVKEFFSINGDSALHQKRMDQERTKWTEISGKRSAAGQAGAEATHGGKPPDKPGGKPVANAKQTASKTEANGKQTPEICQDSATTPVPSPKPSKNLTSFGLEEAARATLPQAQPTEAAVGPESTAAVVRNVKFGLRQAHPPREPKRDKWDQIEAYCDVPMPTLPQPADPLRSVEEQLAILRGEKAA